MPGAISAGVAYIDVLPNMTKFSAATSAQASGATGALAKFGKTGALALGAVGAASVVMGADFEKSMRNVNSIAKLPEPQFAKLNDQVLALAGPTAQAPKTLADGLYELVSSGFSAQESMKILKSSAIAATAGLTDTGTATEAVASILNAYQLPASKAKQVSDQLFKTVEVGSLTFEELASNIGDGLSVANSINVPLEQVGAALATLTNQGEGTPEAMTKIKAAMTALVKPSDEMESVLKQLNVASGADLIEKFGSLQAALVAVRDKTDGSSEAMNKLFPNIRAAQGALALTGPSAEKAADHLKEVEDASGAAKDAFNEQSKALAFQWQRLKAQLSVLAIKIGSFLIPPISKAVKWLNEDFGDAIRDVIRVAGDIGSAIGGAFGDAAEWIKTAAANVKGFLDSFIPLQVAIAAFKAVLWALQPVFAVIAGAFKILGSIIGGAFRIAWAIIKQTWEIIKAGARVVADVIGIISNLLRGDFAGAWKNVKDLVGSVWNFIKVGVRTTINVVKTVFKSLLGVAKAIWSAISGVVKAAFNQIKTVANVIKTVIVGAWRIIASVAKSVWGAIKSVVGEVAGFIVDRIRDAISIAKSIFQTLKATAQTVFSAIGDFIHLLLTPVRAVVDAVRGLGDILSSVLGALDDVIDKAGDAVNAVQDIAGLPGKALDAISPFARGGPIGAGEIGLVGERGPELFVPRSAGRIIPNRALAAGPVASGKMVMVIENWDEGTGFVRRIAATEDRLQKRFDRQRERQSR